MVLEIKIKKDSSGVKPKGFLKKNITLPFFKIKKYIENGKITINGEKIDEDRVLHEGDILRIDDNNVDFKEKKSKSKLGKSKDMGVPILAETDDFLVLDKLPGIVIQGAENRDESILNHLRYLQKVRGEDNKDFTYWPTHRLDKETSGLLLIAKNQPALREINKIFKHEKPQKKYICLNSGIFNSNESTIDNYLKKGNLDEREKVKPCSKNDKGAKRSITHYKILDRFEFRGEELNLVEVEIETGMTHQIRVHMKYMGTPILGDKIYGNSTVNEEFEDLIDRQVLHANKLKFNYKGKLYEFESPLPKDIKNFLKVSKR